MVGAVGRVSLVVRLARLEEILPLRHAVLRPGKPASAAVFDRDDDAVHIGAWDGEVVVGCATVFADPWAGADGYPAEPAAWRLRGMAVAPTADDVNRAISSLVMRFNPTSPRNEPSNAVGQNGSDASRAPASSSDATGCSAYDAAASSATSRRSVASASERTSTSPA